MPMPNMTASSPMQEDDMSAPQPQKLSDSEVLAMIKKIIEENESPEEEQQEGEGPEGALAQEMTGGKKPGYI